jgi:hypothetical protein
LWPNIVFSRSHRLPSAQVLLWEFTCFRGMQPWALNKAFVLGLRSLVAYKATLTWKFSTANMTIYGTKRIIGFLRSRMTVLLAPPLAAFEHPPLEVISRLESTLLRSQRRLPARSHPFVTPHATRQPRQDVPINSHNLCILWM